VALQLRFEQIKHDLQREIRLHYQPGDKFLSQREIMNRYEASLSTVERALRELVNENTIVRIHGKGTFIATPEPAPENRTRRVAILLMSNVTLARYHFYPEMLLRVNDELSHAGYSFSYLYMNDFNSVDPVVKLLTGPEGFDAALLVGVVGDELVEALHLKRYPFVILDNLCHIPGVASVTSDGEGGAFQAVEYLLELGHRQIGFVSRNLVASFLTRYEGYCRAMMEHGIMPHRDWVIKYLPEDQTGALDGLLAGPERPTALLAANDACACQILKELKRKDIAVPEEISVMGFDGEWSSENADPPLTTMEVPRAEMGKTAAAELIRILETGKAKSQVLPVKLIERASTIPLRPAMKKVNNA